MESGAGAYAFDEHYFARCSTGCRQFGEPNQATLFRASVASLNQNRFSTSRLSVKIRIRKSKQMFTVAMLLMATASLTGASAQTTATTESPGVQSCKGVRIALTAMQHTGPGDITAQFQMQNTNNDDMAMFVYYGGANGRNTFLMDETGTEWPKKRQDGNGNHRQALMAGVQTKYSLIFHVGTGGNDARNVQLIEWVQLLPLAGMGEVGWCKYQFANVPVN